jgi:DNA-binding LacI/PurR family transcriptional regulator
MAQVTIKEVARKAGVSTAVVSYILRGITRSTYRPETIARVQAVAQELGYEANGAARLLRQKTTNLIGLAIDIRQSYLDPVVQAAYTEIIERHYEPVLIEPRHAHAYSPFPGIGLLAGVLSVDAMMMERVPEFYETLQQRLPVVALYPLRARHYNYVATDRARAVEMAVEHLAGLGHQRIAFAAKFGTSALVDKLKVRGWRNAQRKYSLDVSPQYSINIGADSVEQAGAKIADCVIKSRPAPTALICAGDDWAMCVMRELTRAGWKVPEQLSIVGYGNTPSNAYSLIRVTVVRPPFETLAHLAVDWLIEQIKDGDIEAAPIRKLVAPFLDARESTAPPPQLRPRRSAH